MDRVQPPFEMPALCTTLGGLGLSRPDDNQSHAMRLLSSPYNVLHEDRHALLGITMHGSLGEIFLIQKDEDTLTYYLKFEIKHVDLLGRSATRVAVWRRCAPGLTQGTSGIIHSLLNDYDAVVSNPSISSAGERFWIDRMGEAVTRGWIVGMMDGDMPVLYDGIHLLDWVQTQAGGERQGGHDCKPFFIKTLRANS